MTTRRPGAPRLIEWTGERCVPWTPDTQVAYEHYHRYLWAAELVRGRRVLDLGSGEGFGSAILADAAASVCGIDVDEATVEHSRLNYGAPTLDFRVASALDLGDFEAGSFDAVVAFEVIEHIVEQDRVLEEVSRVLTDDGIFVVSTPDRRVYSQATGHENPFHEHELDEPEFRTLLAGRFSHLALWGQRTATGSRIVALDDHAAQRPHSVTIERVEDDWRRSGDPAPMYMVAVASRKEFDPPSVDSTLSDYGLQLLRDYERTAVIARRELASTLAASEAQTASDQASLVNLARSVDAAQQERRRLTAENEWLRGERSALQGQVARIDQSVTWRAFQRARATLYGAIGEQSRAGRFLGWSLRALGRLLFRGPHAPAAVATGNRIRVPAVEEPDCSLIIPVHSQAELTASCLRSVARELDGCSCEVIAIDDMADLETRSVLRSVDGLRLIDNEENLGYLRSVNRAAAEARGRYLVLLNNDIELRPGCIDALIARAESAPDVGAVVPKLLFPDGTLQEAGAIVFRDGSGWNFGRWCGPDWSRFNYVREVDYGSAACMLVRADLFRSLGGYDCRYAPMYYEDADLCFGMRRLGYRVLYEPTAEVVHAEGATAGTDVGAGHKRFQEINRPKFVEKWSATLEAEHLPHAQSNVRKASDRCRGPRVLVIDHRVPTPDHDAGSLRMAEILKTLVSMGCRVTFLPDNLSRTQPYTERLESIGVEVLYTPVNLAEELEEMGADLRLAIVSRPDIASRYVHLIREYAPDATIAYDTVDLHHVREFRRAALEQNGTPAKAVALRELELALVRAADRTIVVSPDEKDHVQGAVPDAEVEIIPTIHRVATEVPPPEGRSGVVFVGGFQHPPNADAVEFLVGSVMPLVWRELGDVPLKVVGPHPPAEVTALASELVEITGWVEDLAPALDQARLMVAPVRWGAGMKGKVTQSLAAGLPTVTTTIGAEGLEVSNGHDILVGDTPEALAAHIIKLYQDDDLWRELSRSGQRVIQAMCTPELVEERLASLLAAR